MRERWQDPPNAVGNVQLAMPPLTPVVKLLILINVGVFLASFLMVKVSPAAWITFRDLFGMTPTLWKAWFPLEPVWQLLTYGFLHDALDLWHVLMNMLFLYFLGTMLEEIVGGRRFLTVYLSAVLVAGPGTLLVGLIWNQPWPTIGASGAVLAVVVAMAVMRPQVRVIFILFPITLRTLALIFVGLDLFHALAATQDGIAHLTHLSGAAYGFVAARRGWVWFDPVVAWQDRRRRHDLERAQADGVRLDELLAKINRDGIQSLSAREKAFLKRASKRRS